MQSKQQHQSHDKFIRNFLLMGNFHLTCWRTFHTCPADTPGEHNHADFYELVVVTGGSARHRLQNQYQRISPGSVLLIKPGLYHEYTEYRNLEINTVTEDQVTVPDDLQVEFVSDTGE